VQGYTSRSRDGNFCPSPTSSRFRSKTPSTQSKFTFNQPFGSWRRWRVSQIEKTSCSLLQPFLRSHAMLTCVKRSFADNSDHNLTPALQHVSSLSRHSPGTAVLGFRGSLTRNSWLGFALAPSHRGDASRSPGQALAPHDQPSPFQACGHQISN
jgi:hypothetical protein